MLGRRQLLGFGLAATVTLIAPLNAHADASGGIVGRVADEGGAPVADAEVVVSSALLSDGEVSLASDGSGAFSISGLDAGFYDVSVQVDGIRRGLYRDVQVAAGTATWIGITLEARVAGESGY